MVHIGTQTIETERLILRRFTVNDAGAAFKNWMSDSNVTRFLPWRPHKNALETADVISGWIKGYKNKNFYRWAIMLKGNKDEPIGNIAVSEPIDERTRCACVGYSLGVAWWHMGIATEALSAVIDYLFDRVGINRIEAFHDSANINSGRVMQKCGMKYEGTMKQAGCVNRGICDLCCYAIVSNDRKIIYNY